MWRSLLVSGAMIMAMSQAGAVELRLLVGGAMREPFEEVAQAYEKRTGNHITMTVDNTGALQRRVRAGEKADLILLASQGMDALEKENRIVAGTRVDLGRAVMAVVIRANAQAPDLRTADALKRALLSARAVALTDPAGGGTAGVHMAHVMEQMGITEQMRGKIVYRTQGQFITEAVVKGEADLGVTFTSEIIPNKGAKIAALLPKEVQSPTNYAAAVLVGAASPDVAKAFLLEFKTPFAHEAIKKVGLEPLSN
jgi:molybdate transport system substrate-binding protein